MAAAVALADRHIVSTILRHLSDMKYQARRQEGPDQPVDFLEFRPTLVPSILVNKLWADEATSILWRRYPHLAALENMQAARRQWYAGKVEQLFISSPSPESGEDLSYLKQLEWPNLKDLELEADWKRHGTSLQHMLHRNLEHLEISAAQSELPVYIAETLLPTMFDTCDNLQSIAIGRDTIDPNIPMNAQVLSDLLDAKPSIKDIRIMSANVFGKDMLFGRLCHRSGLEALEIDLDPGLQLLPLLQDGNMSNSFASLRKLHVMCYPEIALALPGHLSKVQQLSMDIARVPKQLVQDSDVEVLNLLLASLKRCQYLELLKVNVGQLATDFPSVESMPRLNGASLVDFATSCPSIKDLTLLVSQPAAIDASQITSSQFDQFCQRVPRLTHLSLKFHPGTTVALEETALQSLGANCPRLELLRLKIALQLPSLVTIESSSDTASREDHSPGQESSDYVEIKAFSIHAPSSIRPLYPDLNHFAFARPQTVLSVAADNYAASSVSQSSSGADTWVEEELVRSWARPLLLHFPRVDILEAWGDWTGYDNDSLNYFLPLEEPLASTWEFLSGIEQDLWDDGEEEEEDVGKPGRYDDDFEEDISFDSRGSGDWDRASLANEFQDAQAFADSGYLHAYDDEPENMPTPVDDRRGWFAYTDSKLTEAFSNEDATHKPDTTDIHHLGKNIDRVTLHPLAESQL
jgi:hypothetical protein